MINKFNLIESLKYLESASKIILRASKNQSEMNPLDYTIKCLSTKIESLCSDDNEYKLIRKYINSGDGEHDQILDLFEINRKNECENIAKYSHIRRRKMLWHGTLSQNIIGIFNVVYVYGQKKYHFNTILCLEMVFISVITSANRNHLAWEIIQAKEMMDISYFYVRLCLARIRCVGKLKTSKNYTKKFYQRMELDSSRLILMKALYLAMGSRCLWAL